MYINLIPLVAQFFTLEAQLSLESLTSSTRDQRWILKTQKGIIFNQYTVLYSADFGLISQADRNNVFDIIKYNNGTIRNKDTVTIISP